MSKLADPKDGHSVPFEMYESQDRCCGLAIKLVGGCCCKFVVSCPKHGERHVGNHD